MLPSVELRIQNLIKALAQVVLPAIDPNNGLAREQTQLVIGHLQLIAEQWDRASDFDAQSLAALGALGELLAASASGGAETQRAAAALRRELAQHAPTKARGAFDRAHAALGRAIEALVEAAFADGSPEFRAVLDAAVLEHGGHQAWRERVWFQGNALDPDRAELPSIDDMLRGVGARDEA